MTTKRVVLFGASLILLLAPALAAEDEDLYGRARTAVFEERWEDARRLLSELIHDHPASPYADDAFFWIGMASYELGEADQAYEKLKEMDRRFPESPWSDDARALMVRCAEHVLKSSAGSTSGGSRAEYESFIEQSTRDSSVKVQLLAFDTMLTTQPAKAPELLPRLNTRTESQEATNMILDRFFEGGTVKVTVENPSLGLEEGNVGVMVRREDEVVYLTLPEAVEQASRTRPGGRFDEKTRAEIRQKLLQAERSLVRDADRVLGKAAAGGETMRTSAIYRVADGEIHYYRNPEQRETIRILVLRRSAGFNDENIRIFVETSSGVGQLGLDGARNASQLDSLSTATTRYLKATLAIIKLDLTRTTAAH